jgi:hypothetical protein
MVHYTASCRLYRNTTCSLLTAYRNLFTCNALHSLQSLPLNHLYVVERQQRLIHSKYYSSLSASIINKHHFSNPKTTITRLEPWLTLFTASTLAH